MTSGKWFCNGRVHGSGSCIILHLVRGMVGWAAVEGVCWGMRV